MQEFPKGFVPDVGKVDIESWEEDGYVRGEHCSENQPRHEAHMTGQAVSWADVH